MGEDDEPEPRLSEAGRKKRIDERERLARALRENLLKRKRQVQSRAAAGQPRTDPEE
jgi:hypothetical protein